jgi:hypothetical protein
MTEQMVSWEVRSVRQLRQRYEQAVRDQEDQFTIQHDGEPPLQFDTRYARYLLEYLEPRFNLEKKYVVHE